jgi:hypothetical protein
MTGGFDDDFLAQACDISNIHTHERRTFADLEQPHVEPQMSRPASPVPVPQVDSETVSEESPNSDSVDDSNDRRHSPDSTLSSNIGSSYTNVPPESVSATESPVLVDFETSSRVETVSRPATPSERPVSRARELTKPAWMTAGVVAPETPGATDRLDKEIAQVKERISQLESKYESLSVEHSELKAKYDTLVRVQSQPPVVKAPETPQVAPVRPPVVHRPEQSPAPAPQQSQWTAPSPRAQSAQQSQWTSPSPRAQLAQPQWTAPSPKPQPVTQPPRSSPSTPQTPSLRPALPSGQFVVDFKKANSGPLSKLGARIDFDTEVGCFVFHEIKTDGLIPDHNASGGSPQFRAGDSIVSCNGRTGKEEVHAELVNSVTLRLIIQSSAGSGAAAPWPPVTVEVAEEIRDAWGKRERGACHSGTGMMELSTAPPRAPDQAGNRYNCAVCSEAVSDWVEHFSSTSHINRKRQIGSGEFWTKYSLGKGGPEYYYNHAQPCWSISAPDSRGTGEHRVIY